MSQETPKSASSPMQDAEASQQHSAPPLWKQFLARRVFSTCALVLSGLLLAGLCGSAYETLHRPGERPVLFLFDPDQPMHQKPKLTMVQPAVHKPVGDTPSHRSAKPVIPPAKPEPADRPAALQQARLDLQKVDVILVVDATSSMTRMMDQVKTRLTEITGALSEKTNAREASLDLQVGLVLYRDHPNQEPTFTTKSFPLTADVRQIERAISDIEADGGGDSPEAVYDGIKAACKQPFRAHSRRMLILVGDAPPHPDGECPCGLTIAQLANAIDKVGATLQTLGIGEDREMKSAFKDLADHGGGRFYPLDNADDLIASLHQLNRDERKKQKALMDLYSKRQRGETLSQIAAESGTTVSEIEALAHELERRGIH